MTAARRANADDRRVRFIQAYGQPEEGAMLSSSLSAAFLRAWGPGSRATALFSALGNTTSRDSSCLARGLYRRCLCAARAAARREGARVRSKRCWDDTRGKKQPLSCRHVSRA